MDEVTPRAVRTEADSVKGSTELRLVLGVSAECPQLRRAVGKLAFITVLAKTVFLKRPTEFSLVSRRVPTFNRLRVAAVKPAVLTTAAITAIHTTTTAASAQTPDNAHAQACYGCGVTLGETEVTAHCPLVYAIPR